MTSPILDIAKLLTPISKKKPVGVDLRQENFANSLYYKLKDLRATARTLERQQIQGTEIITKPDWHSIYQLAVQALEAQSKDLEIVVWLIEALLREHGFAGLNDGFKLAKSLLEHYWDTLYPLPDEDGLITHLSPLAGLNGEETEGTLIVPIALVPLTQGNSVGPFALWQYQQALEIIKIADPVKRNQRLASGSITLEQITQAATETPADFFQEQLHNLQNCIGEFNALNLFLEQKAGHDAPPSSRILAQLNACIDCINSIAKDNLSARQNNSANLSLPANEQHLSITIPDINSAKITREEVLTNLLVAAAFFKKTEPHSPIPYLLERAVRWSSMPLPDLIKEIIKHEQALGDFCNLTGIVFKT